MKKWLIYLLFLMTAGCLQELPPGQDITDPATADHTPNIIVAGSRAPGVAFDTVNTGTGANTGTGDPLRTAFEKINVAINLLNDVELYNATGKTGTGNLVYSNSPVFTTPNIGTATGSITGNAGTVTGFTPDSGSLTLSGADAVTLTTTAATNVTLPTSGTLATLQNINDSLDARIGGGTSVTDVGEAFITLANPGAVTFPQINADNTVTALSASAFTTAIGASHVYSDTMAVSAGVLRTKATTITTEPYSVQIFNSNGKDITHAVSDSVALNGGYYNLYVYSVDALSGCKIKILY